MPRLKPSLGLVRFKTTVPDEFQRWLFYEIAVIKDWNPTQVSLEVGDHSWYACCKPKDGIGLVWEISWDGKEIQVGSDLPVVHLRKGLQVNMGSGTIIIEGNTP